MVSLKTTIQTAKTRYQSWTRRVEVAFLELVQDDKLENLSKKLSEAPTAMVFGAGMSTVTKRFNQAWNLYRTRKDIETYQPFWNDVDDIFRFGAIWAAPHIGLGILPDIVNKGHVPIILVFNYNCHIETCFQICDVGYRSLVYDGASQIEEVIMGTPNCQILKPHGSYRYSGGRTEIVLPTRKPTNEYLVREFARLVIEQKIRNIAIIGWSGNQDDYVRTHLEELLEKSGGNIANVVNIDLANKSLDELSIHSWDILTENPILLEGGGNDALIGLARKLGIVEPRCLVQKPHQALLEQLDSLKQKPTKVKI